ncbi:MAG TPA: 3-methyl-2-oxobutanoate hydroxymethyltransferase [Ktedonobacteraceae bacterium]|nr:3-methyl-2-oxobutanoate hydroxymethyltransferase [Ktedonobacteraceae bacterium]
MREKVTVPSILARKGGPRIRMVTAYDGPSARIADRAEADIILVGDSLGTVILEYENTLPVTVDTIVYHSAAVTRTKPQALVVGDMPWLSFHLSAEETVRNAGRLIREGGVSAVKLEGGRKRLPMIEALLAAEIPVMGHLGLTPQSFHSMGGFKVQGKKADAARELLADAHALANAGVFSIILEGIPDVLAQMITREVQVPTIGIGAGPHCDGQVLVFHDVLGFHDARMAKFVRQYARLFDTATEALQHFFADVQSGEYPSAAESYHMNETEAESLSLYAQRDDHR